jgi:hypothetical protein
LTVIAEKEDTELIVFIDTVEDITTKVSQKPLTTPEHIKFPQSRMKGE